jgi:hypothetical protein
MAHFSVAASRALTVLQRSRGKRITPWNTIWQTLFML